MKKSNFRIIPLSQIFTTFLCFYCHIAVAQTDNAYQLNQPLIASGDVKRIAISPDNQHVIFVADQNVDERHELYSVSPSRNSPVTKLSPDGMNLLEDDSLPFLVNARISSDSSRVVFVGDQNLDDVYELYSVPIEGGTVIQLSDYIQVEDFRGRLNARFNLSEDSNYVTFQSDHETAGAIELYSVPITGGTRTKLNGTLTEGGNVNNHQISGDSTRVIYLADQDSDDLYEIFSVPINGPNPAATQISFTSGIGVTTYALSPDSSKVIYTGAGNTADVDELYSVDIGGGTSEKLNSTLITEGDVSNARFTNDSTQVVYTADAELDGSNELYKASADGTGSAVKLSHTLDSDTDSVSNFFFRISDDDNWVVYRVDSTSIEDDPSELFSVSLVDGTVMKISPDSDDDFRSFIITPDSNRVIINSDEESDDLYSSPIAGPNSMAVNLNVGNTGTGFSAFGTSNQSDYLYYIREETIGVKELFRQPIAGGTSVKINGTLDTNAGVSGFFPSFDGKFVIYLADENVVGQTELFLRELDDIDEFAENEELCVPITTQNNSVILVCL